MKEIKESLWVILWLFPKEKNWDSNRLRREKVDGIVERDFVALDPEGRWGSAACSRRTGDPNNTCLAGRNIRGNIFVTGSTLG